MSCTCAAVNIWTGLGAGVRASTAAGAVGLGAAGRTGRATGGGPSGIVITGRSIPATKTGPEPDSGKSRRVAVGSSAGAALAINGGLNTRTCFIGLAQEDANTAPTRSSAEAALADIAGL